LSKKNKEWSAVLCHEEEQEEYEEEEEDSSNTCWMRLRGERGSVRD
jgi:hypothetical protein